MYNPSQQLIVLTLLVAAAAGDACLVSSRAAPPVPAKDPQQPVTPSSKTSPSSSSTQEEQLAPSDWDDAVTDLRKDNLRLPLDNFDPQRMKGSFYEMRGTSRHEATDMLAPRNTPVHAVSDGTIAKLFQSQLGGNTIYQYDPSKKYVFYYAHLERYAPDLKDEQTLKRGDVIGYVGTSGNAPPNTPHLHFSIGVIGREKQWWNTKPLDPYEVFAQAQNR
jgi:murein DD-endopeptidase MepM/ murein hydrolase activator NlpD